MSQDNFFINQPGSGGGSGGTLESDSAGSQATIAFTSTSSSPMENVDIKDIAVDGTDGSKVINAKKSNNLGNNDPRLIFVDKLIFI